MPAVQKTQPSLGALTSPRLACERLNVSVPTLYKLLAAGELESVKIGKYRKVLERSIDGLIARRLAEAKSAA